MVLTGGAAYAAFHLAKNSVGTKQLKNRSVTAAKIKKRTITGAQINLASLGTVPSAAEAMALGGQSATQLAAAAKLHCPAGMEEAAGFCLEAEPHAGASWEQAVETCGNAGLLLPLVSQLYAFQRQYLPKAISREWAGQIYFDGTELRAEVITASKEDLLSSSAESASTSHPYRCGIPPSN